MGFWNPTLILPLKKGGGDFAVMVEGGNELTESTVFNLLFRGLPPTLRC